MATKRKGWTKKRNNSYRNDTYYIHRSGCRVDQDKSGWWYYYGGGATSNSLWMNRSWPTWIEAAEAAEAEMARKETTDGN